MIIVHYLNQFFGGLGGEERAGVGLEARDGAVGPGKLLEQLFGGEAKVVLTLVCGDNYAVENQHAMLAAAAGPLRKIVGSAQNGEGNEYSASVAAENAVIASAR